MSFTIEQISPSLLRCGGRGMVDHDAFIALFRALSDRLDCFEGVRFCCDIRGCDSTLDFQKQLRILDYVFSHTRRFAGSRWAMIADSPLLVDIAKTAGILVAISNLPFEHAEFETPFAAAEWLGLSREELNAVDDSPTTGSPMLQLATSCGDCER